ncbi:MAG TPA: F0F1 ATP synthase subunit B [Thioploca sp.]|nr:MAG: F0F1 ATP synthase subunit B [Beggiatoa sp. 4572_84]RKZ59031.1 MAG: F0F1 ATP synthase subunit B [Gammaproteobacteria bacterium]HDN27309.1 F0F1 ATP synthase subunit B [Thioploca sp.]
MNITVTLFGQILTFVVLVAFVWRVLWGPMTQMMEARRVRIADGLAAAERGKHDLELAERRAAERLREAKQDAADIVAVAGKRGNEIIEEAKEQAQIEGERQLAVAISEIEQESNRAREDLRRHFGNLVLATAEKILEREIDAPTHSEFINKMVKKL